MTLCGVVIGPAQAQWRMNPRSSGANAAIETASDLLCTVGQSVGCRLSQDEWLHIRYALREGQHLNGLDVSRGHPS